MWSITVNAYVDCTYVQNYPEFTFQSSKTLLQHGMTPQKKTE